MKRLVIYLRTAFGGAARPACAGLAYLRTAFGGAARPACAGLAVLCLAACGGSKPAPAPPTPTTDPTPPAPVAAKVLVNVDAEGVGINGFDPVGYVKDNKVTTGKGDHATAHGGATYWFASAEHKTAFDAEPAKFAPQYGGYCAYAASQNRLSPIQPEVFEIYEGQLLLFTNKELKALFDKDPAKHKAAADRNWPGLVEKHGKPAVP